MIAAERMLPEWEKAPRIPAPPAGYDERKPYPQLVEAQSILSSREDTGHFALSQVCTLQRASQLTLFSKTEIIAYAAEENKPITAMQRVVVNAAHETMFEAAVSTLTRS